MVTLMLVTFLSVIGFTITAFAIDITVDIIVTLIYIFFAKFVFIFVVYVNNFLLQVFKVVFGLVDTAL